MELLYIAGPMAGIPEFNYPAFDHAERVLIDRGFAVVNPARLDRHNETLEHSGDFATGHGVETLQRAAFLKRDFYHLAKCDGIAMLDGWTQSTGANAELAVALMIGLDVYSFSVSGVEIRTPWILPRMGLVADHMRAVAKEQLSLQSEEWDTDIQGGRARLTFTGATEGISE